jgi:regulatory protein
MKKHPLPLNPQRLREMALRYVGRYATSKARLSDYLKRKLRERGWENEAAPPAITTIIDDFERLGFVDDAAFAMARAKSLSRRGMGLRRIQQDLQVKGIAENDAHEAREQAEQDRWMAADRFAKRKRIGPYANEQASQELQQKQLQAFLRAGHSFEIAKIFVRSNPSEIIEYE